MFPSSLDRAAPAMFRLMYVCVRAYLLASFAQHLISRPNNPLLPGCSPICSCNPVLSVPTLRHVQWYSLSSAPNPNWSKQFSSQTEILQYVESTIASRGLLPHIQFHTKVLDCTWDADKEEYDVVVEHFTAAPNSPSDSESTLTSTAATASSSTIERLKAAVVISAVGGLHVPNIPADIKRAGLENFKGDWWHAASWRHDISLKGKKVGIVGTGCCAVQVVPVISEDESTGVVNFCRTPSWFIARVSS